ncbi:hypothetical protein OG455_14330 [Kitasatospora sp. NBC_01287]|uniref:hypothetical protein n=1 Tax=Kitasatospora sp. NBC_01287 TaxID=2903573 RepID=UPI00224FA777|nr:hypothetical protein [Kitasatospora sp. NBC_01287]MCX4746681.1 hypothetical protein [Kitasatospora sp. NBC_01287]
MSDIRRQVASSFGELTTALTNAGLDLPELGDGFQLTELGTLLLHLRPLTPAEVTQLARALDPATRDARP